MRPCSQSGLWWALSRLIGTGGTSFTKVTSLTPGNVPAASVVGESMVALELTRAFLDKYAGDTLEEVRGAYEAHLRRMFLKDLHELEALQSRRRGDATPLARVEVN